MRVARARLAVLAAAVLVAGCGGGERQDADSPEGSFDVAVTEASFPAEQSVAERATLRLEVANRGDRTVPELAVTVETEAPGDGGQAAVAFGQRSGDTARADSGEPVWVLDAGPAGGDSAHTNTWAVGPLGENETRTIAWDLTPVQAGTYTVTWRLAPALVGDATIGGDASSGEFEVTIDDEPVPARVGADGEVITG